MQTANIEFFVYQKSVGKVTISPAHPVETDLVFSNDQQQIKIDSISISGNYPFVQSLVWCQCSVTDEEGANAQPVEIALIRW